jgi:L-lactate dehydrogenase complex protein LldE
MKKVALFIPCFVDQLLPEVGLDMARVLVRAGCEVNFPEEQTCCGQPAFNSGYWQDARPVAERFVRVFGRAECVVCPSGSCTAMVRRFYPELLDGTRIAGDAKRLGERVFEFSEFLVRVMGVTEIGASFPHRVTYHDACHTLRELGIRDEPRCLLAGVRGLTLVEMENATECCGFGGTFSTKFPAISAAMGESKAAGAERAGAEFVTSTDPSCLLQIDGILRRRNSPVRAIHLASILARTEAGGANSRMRE